MPVVTIEVPELGNRAHLVHDGRHGIAIDPPRDAAGIERAAEEVGVDLVAVAETHVHNDYVSGGLGLATRHRADYVLAADESVSFDRVGVRGGDVLTYGGITVEVLDTPGHTLHHQSFLARVDDEAALFSGGSLLLGTVGRTDLVDRGLALRLAGVQWDSVRRLAGLDPSTLLRPTHGFGSFCAGSTVSGPDVDDDSTLAGQLPGNPALRTDRAAYAAELVAGFGPVPDYYDHMAPLNRTGAGDPLPVRTVSAEHVDEVVRSGGWVIDTRDRASHARGHLRGSVGFELGDQFATYVGWLTPWGQELVLLVDDADQVAEAARQLAGIGIEGVGTHLLGPGSRLDSSFRRATWADFARADRPVVVDVRQRIEWEAGHLPGSVHVPVQDLERAIPELPDGELWVHCLSGYRAGIAASLLHRHGRDVVHVDDTWERVAELDIPTIAPAA